MGAVATALTRASVGAFALVDPLAKPYVPLMLTVGPRRHDTSLRWKEVVEPRPGRFTHHLELRGAAGVDDAVRAWIAEAWARAG